MQSNLKSHVEIAHILGSHDFLTTSKGKAADDFSDLQS